MSHEHDPYKVIATKIKENTLNQVRNIFFNKQLSVQEVFEYFACLVADGDPRAVQIIEEFSKLKFSAKLQEERNEVFRPSRVKTNLSSSDIEVIYNLLSDEDPIGK